jgi:hypothetical protein
MYLVVAFMFIKIQRRMEEVKWIRCGGHGEMRWIWWDYT